MIRKELMERKRRIVLERWCGNLEAEIWAGRKPVWRLFCCNNRMNQVVQPSLQASHWSATQRLSGPQVRENFWKMWMGFHFFSAAAMNAQGA